MKSPTYKDLLALAGIGTLSTDDALEHVAQLVDACQKPRHEPGIETPCNGVTNLKRVGSTPFN